MSGQGAGRHLAVLTQQNSVWAPVSVPGCDAVTVPGSDGTLDDGPPTPTGDLGGDEGGAI